jgi:hypothetical protein
MGIFSEYLNQYIVVFLLVTLCCSVSRKEVVGVVGEKSLRAVFLGSTERYILITCDVHQPLWLVSIYGELK